MTRDLRSETFDERRERMARQDEAGRALAEARWGRGQRLTEKEAWWLGHLSRFGSDAYPVFRRGSGWVIETDAAKGFGIFRTKKAAWVAWEVLVASWERLKGLEAQERTVKAGECDVCSGPLGQEPVEILETAEAAGGGPKTWKVGDLVCRVCYFGGREKTAELGPEGPCEHGAGCSACLAKREVRLEVLDLGTGTVEAEGPLWEFLRDNAEDEEAVALFQAVAKDGIARRMGGGAAPAVEVRIAKGGGR